MMTVDNDGNKPIKMHWGKKPQKCQLDRSCSCLMSTYQICFHSRSLWVKITENAYSYQFIAVKIASQNHHTHDSKDIGLSET